MKLFSFFLALSLVSAITDALTANSPSTSNTTLLTFDSLPTTHGLAPLPSPYHHLLFRSLSLFAPRSPSLRHLISPHDLNCATSAPNALIGSRVYDEGFAPSSIVIANTTSMSAAGLRPYFSLLSFAVKPLDAPDVGTTVFVKGYPVGGAEPLRWEVAFPAGYHLPFRVEMARHSREVWERLGRVEMWAAYGESGLDWEFCVDDLELQVFEAGEGQEGVVPREEG